jgi:hypothetical protein
VPASQAAWIVEKFWAWTDCDGHPEHVLTRDELLDNLMLYWLPGTAASSARLYWESFTRPGFDPVAVPTGCSIFPKELMRNSRRWAATRFTDIRYWNELDRAGTSQHSSCPMCSWPNSGRSSRRCADDQAAEPRTRRPARTPVSASWRRVTSPATSVAG